MVKAITETAKSQVVNRVIIGNDMGGSLWATAIHNCRTNKDSYYGLKDRDGKRKEDRFYDLIRLYREQGYAVDVFYEAGRYGFSPARILMSLGAKVHILPINKLKVIMCGKVIKTDNGSGKNLLEQFPEHLRIPSVHGIGERRFRHCGHPKVIQPIVVRYQSAFNFTQRILSGDLRIKTGQELLPCRKCLAIMVPGQVFYGFFKTISGNEVEKLLKMLS